MSRLTILLRKWLASYRVRALELRLNDNIIAGDHCRDNDTLIHISLTRRILQRELVHARMRRAEFDAPGVRHTHTVA